MVNHSLHPEMTVAADGLTLIIHPPNGASAAAVDVGSPDTKICSIVAGNK